MTERSGSSSQNSWRPSSEAVGAEAFGDVIEMGAVIVHFWAPWNPYDKAMDANLQQVKGKWEKRFQFFSVNTDETAFSQVVETHHVAALPTLLCFVDGKLRGRFHGVETVDALEAFLKDMAESAGRR